MDGEVIIGTRLDTKQLEKDLKNTERQLKQYEKEAEKLAQTKLKAEANLQSYEEEKRLLNEIHQESMAIARTEEERNIQVQQNNKLLEGLKQKYSTQIQSLNEVNDKIKENTRNQGLLNTKVGKLKQEIDKTKGFDSIKQSINNVGNSIENVVKKVARWGLAIFGVRSAYMFVRQAMSALAGYNDQIGADVEYIRFALATALQPVIEAIIKLAYKLLTYTAYIAKAWFGVNIFAKASSKAFNEANNKVKATNKSAKELQKTLTGFDEMNILQENGGVSTGGGGGGITMPSMDLSDFENVKIPGWVEWLANNGNLIKDILIGIGAAIATLEIAKLVFALSGMSTSLPEIFKALSNMSALKIFGLVGGIAIAVLGIYETIKNLIKWIGDPTWENFEGVLSGLETVLIGVGTAMIALNATNPVGWIILAVGAVGKLVGVLFDEENQAYSTKDAEKALKDSRKNLAEATDEYVNAVDNAEEAEKKLKEAEEKTGLSGKKLYDQVKNGTLDYKNMDKQQREVYKAYLANKEAQVKLKDTSKNLTKATKDETYAIINKELAISKETGEYNNLKKAISKAMKEGKISTEEATKYMEIAMIGMSKQAKKTFAEDIPDNIKEAFDMTNYGSQFNTFKGWWNSQIDSLNKSVQLTITGSYNITSNKKKSAKGAILYSGMLPKLAVGGIINKPGAGVPYRGAIIGERGAEAVVPLTDSQQMALLGEVIGKYITVDLTNITQLDGRQIARKVEQISNNNRFVLNR